jgi:hypothetical protein
MRDSLDGQYVLPISVKPERGMDPRYESWPLRSKLVDPQPARHMKIPWLAVLQGTSGLSFSIGTWQWPRSDRLQAAMKGNMKVPRATIVAWAKHIAKTGQSGSANQVEETKRTMRKLEKLCMGITTGNRMTLLSLPRPPLLTFHVYPMSTGH